jgi:hypothetical protein
MIEVGPLQSSEIKELLHRLLWIESERMELDSPGSNIKRTIAALRTIKLPQQ